MENCKKFLPKVSSIMYRFDSWGFLSQSEKEMNFPSKNDIHSHDLLAPIEWDPSAFSVGHSGVDEQHKTLVGLINALIKYQDQEDEVFLKKVLNTLVEYTKNHFKFEENLLLDAKYQNFQDHKKQHEKFITKIEHFQHEFNLHHQDISMDILKFLKQWMVTHILIHDKDYADVIKNG